MTHTASRSRSLVLALAAVFLTVSAVWSAGEVTGRYVGNGKEVKPVHAVAVPREPWNGETAYTLILALVVVGSWSMAEMQSEKRKMLGGELYRATDPELVADHLRVQPLLEWFNATRSTEAKQRTALLSQIFGAFGSGSVIKPSFRCDYGYNIAIGRNVFANYDCVFLDCNRITIGDDVQIGPSVQIYTAQHPTDPETRRSGLEFALPVTIGDNVWIGGGAIVCPGVTIGADTVVGAGSVVVRDLPPGVIAVGNPCRVVRRVRGEG